MRNNTTEIIFAILTVFLVGILITQVPKYFLDRGKEKLTDTLGASQSGEYYGDPIPFTTIKDGYYSGEEVDKNYIAKTEEEFAKLWKDIHGTITPKPPIPAIDFTEYMVIGMFKGLHNPVELSSHIKNIYENKDSIVVEIEDALPAEKCEKTKTSLLGRPFHLIYTKTSNKPIQVKITSKISPCLK